MDSLGTCVEGIGNELLDSLVWTRVEALGEQLYDSVAETDLNIVGLIADGHKGWFIGHGSTVIISLRRPCPRYRSWPIPQELLHQGGWECGTDDGAGPRN